MLDAREHRRPRYLLAVLREAADARRVLHRGGSIHATDEPRRTRSAGLSYLLYRRPALIIEREDLLRPSNNLEIPPYLLGGAYQLWFEDSVRNAAVYASTASDVSAYRRDRRLYLENVAHVSHLSRVTENGRNLTFAESEHALAFVREGWRELVVTRDYSLALHFDTGVVPGARAAHRAAALGGAGRSRPDLVGREGNVGARRASRTPRGRMVRSPCRPAGSGRCRDSDADHHRSAGVVRPRSSSTICACRPSRRPWSVTSPSTSSGRLPRRRSDSERHCCRAARVCPRYCATRAMHSLTSAAIARSPSAVK